MAIFPLAEVLTTLKDLTSKAFRIRGEVDVVNSPIGETLVEQKTNNDATYTAEVVSLNITSNPTSAGDITITLDGVATNIAVDPTTDTTIDAVATKIRNTIFTGWTTSGSDATVSFTATTPGNKIDSTYNAGTTGVIGTMVTNIQGTNPVLTFSSDISAIEIYHEENTWQEFIVNGITLKIPSGSYRSLIEGTPSTEVIIPNISCIVGRLE